MSEEFPPSGGLPSGEPEYYWAKTIDRITPGISVFHHCVNVGLVARGLAEAATFAGRSGFHTSTVALLAALHDVGKVSSGFQQKCVAWIQQRGLCAQAEKERWANCESDHSKVSQFSIGRLLKERNMKAGHSEAWATAIGAHHGAPHGWSERGLLPKAGMNDDEWEARRRALAMELERVFGPLLPPALDPSDSRLWAIAGLVSVADWIGSDEEWFPPDKDPPIEESRARAEKAVIALGMDARHITPGLDFGALFGGKFPPNSLQQAVVDMVKKPGIFVLEAPMGMGKTEAALAAAYRLLADGSSSGLYFALPTQATSNGIHHRMAPFVNLISAGTRGVRLIHGASWLTENLYVPRLRLNVSDPPQEQNRHEEKKNSRSCCVVSRGEAGDSGAVRSWHRRSGVARCRRGEALLFSPPAWGWAGCGRLRAPR